MKAIIDEKGLVTVQFEQSTPDKVRALVETIKTKYTIKNNNELAKLFGLEPKNGSIIAKWCMDESKASSVRIPALSYQWLLVLAGGSVSFEVEGSKSPAKLTKKIIVDAACKRFNIKPEYLTLYKSEGEYYWGGKLASITRGSCTYLTSIKESKGLEQWLGTLENELKDSNLLDTDINGYIESINWNVDYEQPKIILG